jgi:hypothetical protein
MKIVLSCILTFAIHILTINMTSFMLISLTVVVDQVGQVHRESPILSVLTGSTQELGLK